MKRLIYVSLATIWFCASASADSVVFDFENAPQHSSFPLVLTVGSITANFSATGLGGFSIQDTSSYIGTLPAGFSGLGIAPNGVLPADLIVEFPQTTVTDFSIMFAPDELALDTTATMRLTAFMNGLQVGTSTAMANSTGTWPSGTLSFSAPAGFNKVVIHYDQPPAGATENFNQIFVADNMGVTGAAATTIPEPSTLVLLAAGAVGLLGRRFRCRR